MKKLLIIFLILTLTLCASLVSCDEPAPSGGPSATTEGGSSDGSTPTAQIVTDENGEAVTDENGEVVTEVIVNTPTEDNEASETNESNPENNESNPETEEDVPDAEPPVAPTEKSPFAWYDAAYRTVSNLTNGTLRFEEEVKTDAYSSKQVAILKISQHTYSMHDDAGKFLCAWVDGVLYDPFSKVAMTISEEDFCADAFPFYPLSNAMIPLTEESLEGISFTEEGETLSFTISLTAEEYSAITGAPVGKLSEMLYTVTFDASTTVMQSVVAKAIFRTLNEETGEAVEYYTAMTVELSSLGTTALIIAPEDADEYETVGDEQNNGGTLIKPEQDKTPSAEDTPPTQRTSFPNRATIPR